MDGGAPRPSSAAELRIWRATVLAMAIGDAHPDDADQIVSAWLADMSGNGPRTAFIDNDLSQIKADAQMWAEVSPRVEIAAYVRAGLEKLAASALAPAMRRQIFAALWRDMRPEDRRAFIERVTR